MRSFSINGKLMFYNAKKGIANLSFAIPFLILYPCCLIHKNEGMYDIFLSQKQYQALLTRLDEINDDVTTLRLKSQPEAGYIDNHDLLILLQVTNRTVQRWRKSGRLPYKKLGGKFFYKVAVILDSFRMHPDENADAVDEPGKTTPPSGNEIPIKCENCPLFVILNSED
jgi:hypothetical protein